MQNPTFQAWHVDEPLERTFRTQPSLATRLTSAYHTATTLAGTTRQLHVTSIATANATSIAELIRRLYSCDRLALVHRIDRRYGTGIDCSCGTC